jgi:hypothetical protein
MHASTQRSIKFAGHVFTITDAAMTAGFGWLVASSIYMKPVYFGALGALSYVLAFLPVVAFALYARGYKPLAAIVMIIYVGGFGANFFSNYGLSASVFKGNIIAADNANRRHSDARFRVSNLRDREAKAAARVDFRPKVVLSDTKQEVSFTNPKAYDALISAYQTKATNEDKKRGGCGVKCEGFKTDVANLIGAQKAAVDRVAAIIELKQIRSELDEAQKAADKTPKSYSIAANQSEYLARLFTQSLQPGDTVKDWTLIYVAVGISLLVSIFAHMCNLISALNLAGIQEEPERPAYARNGWLPDNRAAEGRPMQPEPAREGHEKVYVLQSETVKENHGIADEVLLNTLKRLDERFNIKRSAA